MERHYPQYDFTKENAESGLARFVRLDNPQSYPFDEFHSHQYNEMLVFLKGGGVHNIDFHEYEIRDHSIHLLGAGSLHWVERGMQSEGFAVVYKDQFLHKLQQYHPGVDFSEIFSRSEVINLKETEAMDLNLLFREILNNTTDGEYMLSLIGALLTKIALTFFPDAERPRKSPADKIIVKMIALINKHYKEHLSAEDYAGKLCLSLSSLERKTREFTGKSVATLQQERLLKEAGRLLCYPGATIKEVAWELGFHEPAYFSHWFKKWTNRTPVEYIKGLGVFCLFALQPALEFMPG
jgi:AraC-like DNA-binding protein